MSTPSIYPAVLPPPASLPIRPVERRRRSDLPGPTQFRSAQRDFLATTSAQWLLKPAEAAAFEQWWETALLRGGRWFAAPWPVPSGDAQPVFRFITAPQWSWRPGGWWSVTAELEVRGRSLAPMVHEGGGGGEVVLLHDTFAGVGSIEGHQPEVGAPWERPSETGYEAAELAGGYLVCNAGATSYREAVTPVVRTAPSASLRLSWDVELGEGTADVTMIVSLQESRSFDASDRIRLYATWYDGYGVELFLSGSFHGASLFTYTVLPSKTTLDLAMEVSASGVTVLRNGMPELVGPWSDIDVAEYSDLWVHVRGNQGSRMSEIKLEEGGG